MVEATFEQAYPIAARAARVRATAAVVSGAIPVADREDFEQEGLTACWRALPQFDPARASLRTFIERVIASRIASLVRAARRSPSHVPLNAAGPRPVDSGAGRTRVPRGRRAALIGVRLPRPAVDRPAAGTLAGGGRPDARAFLARRSTTKSSGCAAGSSRLASCRTEAGNEHSQHVHRRGEV